MSLEARFQLREKLGEGATSEVYAASDKISGHLFWNYQ